MNRTEQLEKAIERAIEELDNFSFVNVQCISNGKEILRAALTAPKETVPVCPVCGRVLEALGAEGFLCSNFECAYEQKDSAQRPPSMKGMHAGEYRRPLDGEIVFYQDCNGQWRLSHPCPASNYGEKDKRWIAVPDAPVVEVQYNGQTIGTMPNGIKDKSSPLSNITAVEVKDAPVREPVSVVPVVEYWRVKHFTGRYAKTINRVIVEVHPDHCFDANVIGADIGLKSDGWEAADKSEYAAAKSPAKVIEPLGNYPDMKLMRDKINELIDRVNRMEANAGAVPRREAP